MDFLWASNEELNLFSRKMTWEDLVDNHLIDCLLPLKHFPKDVKVAADFGTGGGLPGVIYAMQFPHIRYRLYEKSRLKQDFLRRCAEVVPNIEVHGDIPPRLNGVDLITARAFKPLDVILDLSRDHLKNGGKYFLLKGRREKIDEEIQASGKLLGATSVRVERLQSPLLEVERHVVLIP